VSRHVLCNCNGLWNILLVTTHNIKINYQPTNRYKLNNSAFSRSLKNFLIQSDFCVPPPTQTNRTFWTIIKSKISSIKPVKSDGLVLLTRCYSLSSKCWFYDEFLNNLIKNPVFAKYIVQSKLQSFIIDTVKFFPTGVT
jgi:hypothetical protein